MKEKITCENIHKNPQCQTAKSRYRNASLTVEAALAFPVFFFAVVYLIQMFFVLRAEVNVAEAAITSARDVAAYSYAAERLADGEHALAEKLLALFDKKIVRDTAMTGLFYGRCDKEVLKQAHVGQGIGGIWVDTEEAGGKVRAEIKFRVKPPNFFEEEAARYYTMKIVYRDWVGHGKISTGSSGLRDDQGGGSAEEKERTVVYMTEHGSVYHEKKTCSHIKVKTEAVAVETIEGLRNNSGGIYYACEFCSPKEEGKATVYITEYGTRYHAVSSCSAISRKVKELFLEDVKGQYRACSKCGTETERGAY
ncbi:MAG: pilus assembly protein [Lachnospiraceae bacterium]|nr:pilus assembly protein [Lachnospiraceae bacterium]